MWITFSVFPESFEPGQLVSCLTLIGSDKRYSRSFAIKEFDISEAVWKQPVPNSGMLLEVRTKLIGSVGGVELQVLILARMT